MFSPSPLLVKGYVSLQLSMKLSTGSGRPQYVSPDNLWYLTRWSTLFPTALIMTLKVLTTICITRLVFLWPSDYVLVEC